MKKLLLGLLVLVVVLVGVAVALPFVLPRDMIKAELERRLTTELDREVRIEGPLELRPWRPFALTLTDVSIANPAWATEPTLARIERIDLEVDALAYLGGTIALDQLLLERPTLALEIRADGTPSWQFETATGHPNGDRRPGDGQVVGGLDLPTIRIGEIRISDGSVSVLDHATGEARSFLALELWARGEPERATLNLDGSVTSAGERATVNAVIGDLDGLLAGEPSSLTLELAAPGLGIAANGEASPSGSAVLAVTADAAPRRLLDWLGQPVELPEGRLETVNLVVDLAAAPTGVALRALTLELDELRFAGDLELTLGDRLRLDGRLDLGELDLRPYLEAPDRAPGDPAAEDAPGAPDGWPDEPLALPLPLPLDLELDVTFASLAADELRLGRGAATLTADARTTRAEITALELYDGRMTGAVTLTNGATSGAGIGLEATAEIIGIQLQPLLDAVADIDRFTGTGNLQFSVTSAGDSVDALIRGLDGEGRILARDGAILGINIGATIRQVMTLGARPAATEPRRTDFAEAGGTFTIEGGVLRNDDFSLRAPVLRVGGAGDVDLGNQTLAYRLLPRIAATLEGQDATREDAFQAGLPMVVQGPWADPAIRLDLGTALSGDISDPAQLAETIRGIAGDPALIQDLREAFGIEPDTPLGTILEGVGGLLEGIGGLLGGSPRPAPANDAPADEPPADGEPAPAPDPARSLLEGLGGLLRR